MKAYHFLLLLLFAGMMSCAKTPFTQNTRMRVQKTDPGKIEKIQFYTDKKIVLMFKTTREDEVVEGGKLKFEKGYYKYFIEIPAGTPGVAEVQDERRLRVHFEEGEDRFLVFGDSQRDRDPYYYLFGEQRNGAFFVQFEDRVFEVIQGANSRLLIRKNEAIESKTERRRVKGVKVD